MAVIHSREKDSVISFCLELNDGTGLIYDQKLIDEFQTWIPYSICIRVKDLEYSTDRIEAFSLIGLKYFIDVLDCVVAERRNSNVFRSYSYCGPENGFEIGFKNIDEPGETITEVDLWINAAFLPLPLLSSSYSLGIRFLVNTEDVLKFKVDLEKQLNQILQK